MRRLPAEPVDELTALLCSAIAQACNRGLSSVSPSTPMLDLNLDSLTLVSVLAQVEAVYRLDLTVEDTVALFAASDVGTLAAEIGMLMAQRPAPPDR